MLRISPAGSLLNVAPPERFHLAIKILAASVAAICVIVLAGWAIDNSVMKSVVPGMITMKVNTAIGLLLLALSLFALIQPNPSWKLVVRISLAMVAAMALVTLSEYVLGLDLRIDNFLFQDHESSRFPGRNAPATNIAFLGLAIALLMLHLSRGVAAAQLILLGVATAPLATLCGYLYRAPGMYAHAPYPTIALNASIALLLICLGGLLVRCNQAVMQVILSQSLSGTLARRLLPAAVGLPMLIGFLVLAGEESHLYTRAFSSALMVACCAAVFAFAVLLTIAHLWNGELQAAAARLEEQRLLDAERAARSDAERANRLKDEFLSLVSHELRTPLTAMLGWAQLLQMRRDSGDIDEGLAIIVDNAHAQRQIIDDLLDMGRIMSGKLKLKLTEIDLGVVLGAAIASVRPAAAAKGIDLKLNLFGRQTAAVVAGDSARLQQIFWNLITNAVKFSDGGSVRVTCTTQANAHVITVSDTGNGIAAEFLPFVFERFRQGDASMTRQHGGLGLGLSIVKQLTEMHGGTVEATSPGTGLGATFTVHLPAIPATAATLVASLAHSEDLDKGEIAISVHDITGLQVLVVDDEPDVRALVKRQLVESGAIVETAASGEEVVAFLRDRHFDVLLSDIGMPGEDGYSLLKRIRGLVPSEGGQIPVIALTAYARPEDRARVLTAGFAAHLTKPIDRVEMQAALARIGRPAAAVRDIKSIAS